MAQTMNATEMTDGQIENAVSKLRDAMRKHRSGISSEVAQQVLGVENLGMIMFAPFRQQAELLSNVIVRTAKVNPNRTQQEALGATGRVQNTNREVVDSMPKGEGDEVEVVFFKPEEWEYTRPGYISDDDLDKAFERRGLKPADPVSVAAVNEDDPAFADEKPHATHWKDTEGNWCHAAFHRLNDLRKVIVHRYDPGWSDGWWFAGVLASSSQL